MIKFYYFLLILFLSACTINPPTPKVVKNLFSSSDLPLDSLNLPKGFKIQIYAKDVVNARSMALSPNGTYLWELARKAFML